jgi:hypothetical protein
VAFIATGDTNFFTGQVWNNSTLVRPDSGTLIVNSSYTDSTLHQNSTVNSVRLMNVRMSSPALVPIQYEVGDVEKVTIVGGFIQNNNPTYAINNSTGGDGELVLIQVENFDETYHNLYSGTRIPTGSNIIDSINYTHNVTFPSAVILGTATSRFVRTGYGYTLYGKLDGIQIPSGATYTYTISLPSPYNSFGAFSGNITGTSSTGGAMGYVTGITVGSPGSLNLSTHFTSSGTYTIHWTVHINP